jgi:N-acyl amino acid synthase of PEP-CTERM/exosortase system
MQAFGGAVAAAWTTEETLLTRYNRDYECRIADDPELLHQAFATRYRVYCLEHQFEDPQAHSSGLETDEYDSRSRHCVLTYRPSGEIMGTVRLILPVGGGLESFTMRNIIAHCGGSLPVPLATTAEVSRFSISKHARQVLPLRRGASREAGAARRAEPLMSLGLIQGLVRMSELHGITHWCAVMEPKMLRMLDAMGIHFTPVGEPLEYHGLRQLCYCDVSSVLRTMRMERPSFWEIVADKAGARAAKMPPIALAS